MAESQHQSLLEALDKELESELVDFACDVINIASPTGEEAEMASYLKSRFESLGMKTRLQEVEPNRENVVARLKGTGRGQSLLFNGHMDTSTTGREEADLPFGLEPKARIIDGWIHGLGISNMKSAFPAYYGALRMIQKAGIELPGDVLVNGVVGEIEKAPIGHYQGPTCRGGGCGTTYAAQHGVIADVSIVGEPTGLRVQPGNTSYMFVQISTKGVAQHTWSKENGVDAIPRAMKIMEALRGWEPDFELLHEHPRMGSRLGIGAIEGGYPYKPSICPAPYCNIYLDVRFPPDKSIMQVRNELAAFLRELCASDPELDADLDIYLCRTGYEIDREDPLITSVEEAHRAVFDTDARYPEPYRYAVSADTAILSDFGVRAMTYGPGGITRDGTYSMYDKDGEVCSIENLIRCTKVYALAMLELCAQPPATSS